MDPKSQSKQPESSKIKLSYFEGVGRRKSACAIVRLYPRKISKDVPKIPPDFIVNDKPLAQYFFTPVLQTITLAPLALTKNIERFNLSIHVNGGGIKAQAEASRLGIARALLKFNANLRKKLKRIGYLTRDERKKERKKPGLKKARRAPQWKKR